MSEEKKYLVTGATGFLGREIVEAFRRKNLRCVTLSRSTKCDISCDLSAQRPQFGGKFQSVIHCAGLAHQYPRNERDRLLFYKSHVIATLNLLKALDAHGCNKFVFISTVAVYGHEYGSHISETMPVAPNTAYGEFKYEAERCVLEWGRSRGVEVYIFRLPLIAGNRPPGNLGAMIKAMRKGYYFHIKGINPRKSMVLASDLGNFFAEDQYSVPGTYNLTDGHHPSMREIEGCIAKRFHLVLPSFGIPYCGVKAAGMVGDILPFFPINSAKVQKLMTSLTFDDHKARLHLGWAPRKVIQAW